MWIDEYIKLCFPINKTDQRMEEAMELKYRNLPTALFKYREVNEYSMNNLLSDEVWFNRVDKLNDPYDSALTLDLIPDMEYKFKMSIINQLPESYKELKGKSNFNLSQVLKAALNESTNNSLVSEFIHEVTEQYRVISEQENNKILDEFTKKIQTETIISCFSEVNDSILMWSHYAANHTGFCVEYDFKKRNDNEIDVKALNPIIYKETLIDMTEYLLQAINNDKSTFNGNVSTYISMIKSKEWAYEKEWRLSLSNTKKEGANLPLFKPEAIYLGTKISEEHKKKLIEIAGNKNISVLQMRMKKNEFKLIPERII